MIKHCIYTLLMMVFFAQCSSKTDQKSQTQEPPLQPVVEEATEEKPVILFFGNSITAGYQLDIADAFPALIQNRLDSLGHTYQVINAGLSGETTAGGLNRIDWVLRTVPEIFILELGANDGLRGLDLKETKNNLLGIIKKVRAVNPEVKVLLAGMQVPPNLGRQYVNEFNGLFTAVAKESGAELIPFVLIGVAGNPELNLSDGIHPTEKGHQIVAETVWNYLNPMLLKPTIK